jgi:hypothetical protein
MNIGNTDGIGGLGRIEGPHRISPVAPNQSTSGASSADKVDISSQAGLISKALGMPAVRAERIAEVKNLIQSGRFDTEQRLNAALDRFLSENPEIE